MNEKSTLILAGALAIIMFGMGLSLKVSDFKRVFSQPKPILLGLISQLILLPAVGFLIAKVFGAPPAIAVGIIIIAASPGGSTSNLLTHLAKGDTALSVSLTAFSSLITIITIPFLVNFGLEQFANTSQMVKLPISKTMIQVFGIVVVPVSIGMILNAKKPNFSLKMEKPVRIASGAILALIIVGLIIKKKDLVGDYFAQAGAISLALNASMMAIGFTLAIIFQLKKKQALTISIETGIQNGTMALMIAGLLGEGKNYDIAPAIYSLIMYMTSFLFIAFLSKKLKNEEA